jgi:hypothetical protein
VDIKCTSRRHGAIAAQAFSLYLWGNSTRIAHNAFGVIRGPTAITAQAFSLCFACGKTLRLFYLHIQLQALSTNKKALTPEGAKAKFL